MIESQRHGLSREARVDLPREILKTGILVLQFPVIWSSNFSCR